MQPAAPKIAEVFEAKAANPRQIHAEAYRQLLEKMLREGRGYGKTKSVAGYLLRNIQLVTDKLAEELALAKEREEDTPGGKKHEIEMPDKYVVVDLDEWNNEYLRMLAIEDIASKWARRYVTEDDLNKPDFKGSGIWTNRKKNFEFDYLPDPDAIEEGKPVKNVYKPNPEAFRLILPVTQTMTVPMIWGNYTVQPGGTLALRERDVAAVAEALQLIRDGRITPLDALYTRDKNGQLVARFDMYGQEPAFLEDNYDPVILKDATKETQAHFSALPELPPPLPLPDDGEELPLDAEELLAQYRFADLSHDGAVFFAKGNRVCNPEDRADVPENDELVQSFIDANDALAGERKYRDMLDYVDRYGGHHIQTTGRGDRLLPYKAKDMSHFEAVEFWRRLQTHFAQAASGTIHVAADNGVANDNFRLFGYPAIMANDKIANVEMITGQPMAKLVTPYVDVPAKKFIRNGSHEDYDQAKIRLGEDNVRLVYDDMIFDEDLRTLPRNEWAEEQKQQWFATAESKLIDHMQDAPQTPALQIIGTYYHDPAREDLMIARVNFLQEIIFSLREAKRLRALAGEGDETAAAMLRNERRRLGEALDVLNRYPDILTFNDEPPSALEHARSRYVRGDKIMRVYIMTQRLGEMLIKLDDSMTLAEKNALWGCYEDYDHERFSLSKEPNPYLGRPREVEDYVRQKLTGLKDEIAAELNANSRKVLQFPGPAARQP